MDISCFLPKLLLTLSLCLPGMLGIGLDLEAKSYWLGLVLGVSGPDLTPLASALRNLTSLAAQCSI